MHRLSIAVAALAAAAAASIAYAGAPDPRAPTHQDPHARVNVTLAEYRRVEIGMDWATVAATVGSRGHAAQKQDGGARSLTWEWMNADGSGMTCVFRDGRLVEKAQKGL